MPNPSLNLYQLSAAFNEWPIPDNDPWHERDTDWCVEMLVAASSEAEARELAGTQSRDEGAAIWRDTTFTKCDCIGTAAERITAPAVLMRDTL